VRKGEGHAAPAVADLPQSRHAPSLQDQFTELQRTTGNHSVNALLKLSVEGPPGLPVGEPDSACEREAEAVAAAVSGTRAVSRESAGTGPQPARSERQPPAGATNGTPLPGDTRRGFESRLGADLGGVRIHTGAGAGEQAAALGARAFTAGGDITFADGQYDPQTPRGRTLLVHELTHVIQQGAAPQVTGTGGGGLVTQSAGPQVQRSIFEDAWEGIKSVGSAVGGAVSAAAGWVGERVRDASMLVVDLVRDLPERLARLVTTLGNGLAGIVTFLPEGIAALASGGLSGFADWLWERAKDGGAWVLTLLGRVFDLLGGPELLEFVWHLITKARPLTGEEITAASSVLGPSAIRWGDVRVSQGGILSFIFAHNDKRAFATFHTINLPDNEPIHTAVHELTHVFQYERAGSVYLGGAIHAQVTRGGDAYNYGKGPGLVAAKAAGKHFRDFNREEQAQIAEDYYDEVIIGGGTSLSADERTAYDYYIGELRAGEV
jgi:hypothetical protein